MEKYYKFVYFNSFCKFLIIHTEKEILKLNFIFEDKFNFFQETKNSFSYKIIKELDEYFSGKRKYFDLPLSYTGTSFQKKVWESLKKIPYGETKTYKEIALEIEKPKSYRAVGLANNKNPLPIFLPCHRVIGTNGKLVGYAGGLELKKKLLKLEKGNKLKP